MEWFQWVSLAAMAITALFCLSLFLRLVKLGKPKDFSEASGSVCEGVLYSNTIAMLPNKKESAYLHLPTYTAGMIFHIGTFFSLLFLLLSFFEIPYPQWLQTALCAIISFAALCGFVLLVKRIFSKNTANITSPDDYISTGLVALFNLMSALIFICPEIIIYYYLSASLLLLYIPVGKLKHLIYYFAARYHLGFFYGRRNSWTLSKNNK